MPGSLDAALSVSDTAPDPAMPVTLAAFLARTGAVLRAGWPDALWVEATIIKATANAGGHALELIDPGPRGAQAGQLRAFLTGAALAAIRREMGLAFDPAQLVGLTAVLRLAPGFDPRWHLQARVLGLARSLQASLAARLLADVRDRLRREGLLKRQRQLPRPPDVTRLAVVHPAGSAGLADVARELRAWQRAGILLVRLAAAPFDGEGAGARLAEAVRRATEPIAGHRPDLVLLVRGGGARSGLLALDDEALARAVATLPVPVVTGLGHATDRALVDQVAHAAADTPSKALAVVRSWIGDPARSACAARDGIGLMAVMRLDGAAADLATVRERVAAGAERRLAGADRELAVCWADFRARVAAGRAQLDGTVTELDRQLGRATDAVPAALDRATADGDRLLRALSEAARRHLGQAPDPAVPMAATLARAAALVATAERDGERLLEAVMAATARLLDHHDGLLRQAEAGLTGLDHGAVLARGYAVVRDVADQVLTTRAAARAAGTLILEFGDGALAVVAVDPQPASL